MKTINIKAYACEYLATFATEDDAAEFVGDMVEMLNEPATENDVFALAFMHGGTVQNGDDLYTMRAPHVPADFALTVRPEPCIELTEDDFIA